MNNHHLPFNNSNNLRHILQNENKQKKLKKKLGLNNEFLE